jgi:hypothetical protein
MAFTNQQIIEYLLANPKLTDSQIVDAMKQFSITPAQLASAVGLSEGAILSRIAATIPNGSSLTLGDMVIVPQYQVTGSGEDQQIGGLESFFTSKTNGDPNYKAPVGTEMQQYGADGTFQQTLKTKKELSFFGGIVDMLKDPVVLAAIGGAAAGGLLGGAGTAAAGTAGMSAAELAQLDLALGGAGGTAGATSLGSALTTGANVGTLTNLTGGSGLLTGEAAGITAQSVADKLAADAALQFELTNAGSGALTDLSASTSNLTNTANTANTANAVNTANTANTATNVANTANAANAVSNVANTASTALTTTELANAAKLGLTAAQYAQLFSTGATTAAGLLQSQTSKEAAQKAQAMIDAETAAAKAASQFRPVGMTTRFGSSNFQVDPKTGQITSAGYTLSPEAKAAQDRFVNLAGQGLTQAEQAQQQFAPLQTGAQRLFGLGNQYLAQTPEQVAQNYMNQQLALLQPGRELELANLQNKLQQQGRGGLSVAQGGSYGATTPELQALYNARAMQEAQLAAQAQQAGQQQVTFGAGLLGQGANAMGQYYGGQQAAYAPYTSAFGQIQALETAAQQPFTMGAALGQQASTAGARAGALGLEGANISQRLATGAAATNNPYATTLSGLAANPAFSQLVGGLFGTTPVNALDSSAYGTGTAGFEAMLKDIYG